MESPFFPLDFLVALADDAKRGKVPCAIRTPEAYYVHLSSENHIKELIEAPEEQLSLHALSKDVCSKFFQGFFFFFGI